MTSAGHRLYHTKNRTSLRYPYGAQPAAGRIIIWYYDKKAFLDIVECLLKLKHYLKFHGARAAFCRVIEGKTTSTGLLHTSEGNQTVLVQYLNRSIQRRPSRHRTVPNLASYDIRKAPRTSRPIPVQASDDARPIFFESNCHRWKATCICRSTYCIYINYTSLLKTKNINTKTHITLEQLRMKVLLIFSVLNKCGFHLHYSSPPRAIPWCICSGEGLVWWGICYDLDRLLSTHEDQRIN